MKVIEINDNGFVWHVPLAEVAKARAEFYSDHDPDTTFVEEYQAVMNDDCEGIDWFENNMNFSDVASVAKLVRSPNQPTEPDINADKRIIEVDD